MSSLLLSASGGTGTFGIANRGFGNHGYALKAGKPYEGYFYAKVLLFVSANLSLVICCTFLHEYCAIYGSVRKFTLLVCYHSCIHVSVCVTFTLVCVQGTAGSTSSISVSFANTDTGNILDEGLLTFTAPDTNEWTKLNFTLTPSEDTICVGIQNGSDPNVNCGGLPDPSYICFRWESLRTLCISCILQTCLVICLRCYRLPLFWMSRPNVMLRRLLLCS